jgi:hypothetical protein
VRDRSKLVIPAKAGIQYAAASRPYCNASGILDHPHSRVMTSNKNEHDENKKAGAACAGFFVATD